MTGKVKCTCGWSWNKSDSSKKDMYICHECGRDNSNNIPKAQEGIKSPNVWAQEQHFQEKNKEDKDYKKFIGNTGEEAIDIVQRFIPGLKYFPGLGSSFAVGEAEAYNQDASASDELGMIPFWPAQAASLMLLDAEVEKENMHKFAKNKYKGKDLTELVPEQEVNNKVIDKTYVPKPKIGKLKETKSKKVPYKEQREVNKVEIDNTRTNKPRVDTNYKPEPKPETEYKFTTPNISYRDDSFVMPEEFNDIKIDNTRVKKPKILKKENGGWLDNYNDSEVSLPEGFVGEGIFNGPKFDNPAWGGQFQNGGTKKPITTREDFDPSVLSNIPGLTSLASGNQPGYNREEQYGPLGDLYRYYGGQLLEHDVLVESQNKPSTSKDKNAKYISLNHDREFVNEVLDNYERVSSGKLDKGIESKLNDNSWSVSGYSSAGKDAHKTKKQGSEHHSNAIGRYTLGKGKDKKGEYISYYDKFDQGTGDGLNPGEALGLTKPFEIYDRIYLKDVNRKYQMGGNLPGAVGNMYARTGSPSKGPRRNQTDVTDASAQNGKEMQYYQNGLDWKPKSISKNGAWLDNYKEEIIKDDRGQWGEHKGEPTRINQSEPGSYIDMGPDPLTDEPLTQPLLGISDKGERKIMYPGEKHKYKKGTKYVDEFPIAKNGLRQEQKGLQNLDQLTNFTNYNKPTIGGWLNKYN